MSHWGQQDVHNPIIGRNYQMYSLNNKGYAVLIENMAKKKSLFMIINIRKNFTIVTTPLRQDLIAYRMLYVWEYMYDAACSI